jgi:hypothetical protein
MQSIFWGTCELIINRFFCGHFISCLPKRVRLIAKIMPKKPLFNFPGGSIKVMNKKND